VPLLLLLLLLLLMVLMVLMMLDAGGGRGCRARVTARSRVSRRRLN